MKIKLSKYIYWVIAVFPFFFSAAFYSRLPDQVAVHWDSANVPDGYASRFIAAFGLPAFLLLIILFVNFSVSVDPRRQNINQSPQLKLVSKWGIVIVANFVQFVTIFKALDYKINISTCVTILLGLLFIAIGNYLPKCKPNYTIGIKLPWTLASEENWRKTHRFAGPVWMIGGLLFIISGFSPYDWPAPGIIIALALIPCIYSYLLFHKEEKDNNSEEK